jgi:hypothetical protein
MGGEAVWAETIGRYTRHRSANLGGSGDGRDLDPRDMLIRPNRRLIAECADNPQRRHHQTERDKEQHSSHLYMLARRSIRE